MKKLLLKGLLLFSFFSFFEAKSAELNCGDVSTSINAWSSIDQIRQELREMNIPVFEFHFKKNEFPTFDVIEHPDSCIGKSIINNNYVEGSLEIFIGDEKVYESGEYLNKESGVRVKCRGNTSTAQDYIKKKAIRLSYQRKLTSFSETTKTCAIKTGCF